VYPWYTKNIRTITSSDKFNIEGQIQNYHDTYHAALVGRGTCLPLIPFGDELLTAFVGRGTEFCSIIKIKCINFLVFSSQKQK
jgi:hypothetical protein